LYLLSQVETNNNKNSVNYENMKSQSRLLACLFEGHTWDALGTCRTFLVNLGFKMAFVVWGCPIKAQTTLKTTQRS